MTYRIQLAEVELSIVCPENSQAPLNTYHFIDKKAVLTSYSK